MLSFTVLSFTVLSFTVLSFTVLSFTVLSFTVLSFTVLSFTVLSFTVLSFTVFHGLLSSISCYVVYHGICHWLTLVHCFAAHLTQCPSVPECSDGIITRNIGWIRKYFRDLDVL